MASFLNEELMGTNLDIPEGEIKITGAANPVYADAINVHNKKKKATEKALKDKKPELKKPFLGTKGETTAMPKTKEMKKLRLSEDMFKSVREHYDDAPDAYQDIFRILDNMEHIINYISELDDESMSYMDMLQSYDVLEEGLKEFKDALDKIKAGEKNRKRPIGEATAVAAPKKLGKDIWTCIYDELNGEIKGVEAQFRRFDRKPKDRYRDSNLSFDGHTIIVKANSEGELDFAKQVADEYGVEFEIREHTSRYAEYRLEMRIHTDKPVAITESVKTLNEGADVHRATADHFNHNIPFNVNDVIADLVDRAIINMDEDYDIDEAVQTALDEGLIYTKDIWTIKSFYEDAEISSETWEALYNDVYAIVSSINGGMNESIDPKYIKSLRDKVNWCYSRQDIEDQGGDTSDMSDEDMERVLSGKATDADLDKMFGHYSFVDDDFGLNESYVKVDTIECGDDKYRVIGGGFNPTEEALVSVESEHGERFRFHIDDVIEFYTWYNKDGKVVHEPSGLEESLKEEKKTLQLSRALSK